MNSRPIIEIDQEKCDGCGQCVSACAEGAIQIIDGKARLVSDVYCDGLGGCLGECPRGAIRIIERPAEAFDEKAVEQRQRNLKDTGRHCAGGCPSTAVLNLRLNTSPTVAPAALSATSPVHGEPPLCHWPIQLHLVPPTASFLKNADVFLAADCVAFACRDFHERILKRNPVLIACPKLDDAPRYVDKLAEIFATNSPRSLTVVRMEVPCCTGLMRVAQFAKNLSGASLSINEIVVSRRGDVLNASAVR